MNNNSVIRCPKCNGTGILPEYKHLDNGKCFLCNGKGFIHIDEEKEIKKIDKNKKSIDAYKNKLIKRLKKEWFNNSDAIYVVNEKNTYSIKENIKADGGKFQGGIFSIWYFTEPKENYNLIKIEWDDVLNDNDKGYAVRLRELIKEKSNNNLG